MTMPPRPNFLTDAERASLDPNKPLNPLQKAAFLAVLAKGLRDQLQDPRLQPIAVDLELRPTGWTLTVDVPPPGRDDLTLPSADGDRT